MDHPHHVTGQACRSMLGTDLAVLRSCYCVADETGVCRGVRQHRVASTSFVMLSCTLNARDSDASVSWIQNNTGRKSTAQPTDSPATHSHWSALCLLYATPAGQSRNTSNAVVKTNVSSPVYWAVCSGRGWDESGRAGRQTCTASTTGHCSLAKNNQLNWTDRAGLCILWQLAQYFENGNVRQTKTRTNI